MTEVASLDNSQDPQAETPFIRLDFDSDGKAHMTSNLSDGQAKWLLLKVASELRKEVS